MSHDIQAAWATAELAAHYKQRPENCFDKPPGEKDLTVYAARQSRADWPITDGVLRFELKGDLEYELAVEFKRENEGLHGILTALGQAHAYLDKGFGGAAIVIPRSYATHADPGTYLTRVLDNTSPAQPIAVITYKTPDASLASPFSGKLDCLRRIRLDQVRHRIHTQVAKDVETQWAHVREGSTEPDALFRYLSWAKMLAIRDLSEPTVDLPPGMQDAVARLDKRNIGATKFLSNSTGDELHDRVWRHFWFSRVFHKDMRPLWREPKGAPYVVHDVELLLQQVDGSPKRFFSGKSNSIKNNLVERLNTNAISEEEAWNQYADNVRKRAHSYREDIDSGLEHLGFLAQDGKPTDLGYRFIDACERTGDSNSGTPLMIFGAALLQIGQLGAFLHYVYRLSEEEFRRETLAFAAIGNGGTVDFDQERYLKWLERKLADDLKVMRKVGARGGVARKPFQAEFAIMRNLNYVGGFRPGVGLEVNWPTIQEALSFDLGMD